MSAVTLPTNVLMTVARSLVIAQRYASVDDALQGMAMAEAQRKIAYYRRRVRAMERKYGTDFDTFSAKIQGQATLSEEDDWLAWRSANSMLADWQRACEEIQSGCARA